MDSGQWALVAVGVLACIGTVYTAWQTRKGKSDETDVDREANSISGFEANIRAFDLRAKNAETRADTAETKANEVLQRVEALEKKDRERDKQLNRFRLVVQTWFRELLATWPDNTPMPLPSEDDLELLGITLPKSQIEKLRRTKEKS